MLINLTDYGSWYLDVLQKRQIIVNSTTNNTGYLQLDENGNRLSLTNIDCGRRDLISMTSNTNGNIIVANETGGYFSFIDEATFTEDDEEYYYMMNAYIVNKIYINAYKEDIINIASGVINIDLTNKSIFKVILNDEEITSYTSTSSSITPTGTDADYFNYYNNRAIVYTYDTDQTIYGETVFEYYAPEFVVSYDEEDYNDGTFFQNMIEFCDFDEFNIRHNETLGSSTRAYKYNEKQRAINRLIEVSVAYRGDKRKETEKNYFRMIGWSEEFRRLTIINNCLNQSGADKSFVINGANTTTQTYTADNYIEIDYVTGGLLGYGLDPYGISPYGSAPEDAISLDVTNFANLSKDGGNQ